MKRFLLFTLPLCFAFAQVAPAEDEAPPADDTPVAPVRGNRPAAQAPLRQPQVQANLPAVQQPQAQPAADFRRGGGSNNPGVGAQPRIYNPRNGGGPRQPRVFTPGNPTFTPPATVQQPQPTPQVVTPGMGMTRPGDPAVTRTWTGRGGAETGGNRGDWANRGTRGDWRTRGGIEGNSDWRTRRRDGDGEATNDWRNNNHTGERRGDWRNGSGRRGEWARNRHNFRRQHNWIRQHRTRDWWRSRYSRFARFGGGYYYWNSGYWYPAYGYDPYFSTYTYDAPLYAYNDQDPGEIIASVQQQLQELGYYRGELDGTYGPMTRRALVDFQRANGLPVTGEIDEPTLASLGFE